MRRPQNNRHSTISYYDTLCSVSKKLSVEVFLRVRDPVTQASGSLFNTRTLTSLKWAKNTHCKAHQISQAHKTYKLDIVIENTYNSVEDMIL